MKKISCPNCGKHKCFTRYVDTEGRYLATGGLNNLKPSEALRDRDVLLLTDLKAEEKWNEKMSAFTPICRSIAISDLLSSIATAEQSDAGLDIADYLCLEDTPRNGVGSMVYAHYLNRIIDAFKKRLEHDFKR
jgi:hypothetical protein